MAQGVDGYWYAYIGAYGFIDNSGTEDYDSTDNNLDYGTTGSGSLEGKLGQHHLAAAGAGQADMTTGASFSMLAAVAGTIANPPTLSDYNGTNNVGADPVTSNADQSSTLGQIGVNGTEWPFIQLYDFTQGDFDIILEQAGADEVVTLDYDSGDLDEYASLTADRYSATQGSEVHLAINDQALNIDPTNEDIVVFFVGTAGSETISFTNGTTPTTNDAYSAANFYKAETMNFGDNGVLKINYDTNGVGTDVFANDATIDDTGADYYLVFLEDADNTGTFSNVDDADDASLIVSTTAKRGTTATIDYNDDPKSFIVANDFGTIDMDESSVGVEWNSGETLAVILVDQDLNKNTLSDEDMVLTNSYNSTIPSMMIGSPITLSSDSLFGSGNATDIGMTAGTFNKIATLTSPYVGVAHNEFTQMTFNGTTVAEARAAIAAASYVFINYDFTEFTGAATGVLLVDASGDALMASTTLTETSGLVRLTGAVTAAAAPLVETDTLHLNFSSANASPLVGQTGDSFYADIFTFGDRVNNAIYRMLLEETGDNTATFVGEVEFVMLNQINNDLLSTYTSITTLSDEIDIIVHEDLTDEDSPRINYLDLGSDGVSTQIADQVEAPSHSGVVTFDSDNYKTADTVVVTLDDQDMNTDSELVDVYITSTDDKVGNAGSDHVLDITFNDVLWQSGNDAKGAGLLYNGTPHDGLQDSGFTLVETAIDSGLFIGTFQVPSTYYDSARSDSTNKVYTTTGTDIEVNYNDHRDASGETIEVGAGASINANTGSVEFDRTVYPVPWGNTTTGTTGDERFALHASAEDVSTGVENALAQGDVNVHIRVTDADYDVSAFGEDTISDTTVVLKIERGSSSKEIVTFGNSTYPITETSPTSGVFEYDQLISFTDGPDDSACPAVFAAGCVLQGDILTVTYSDIKDASGQAQTVTDSATFDLRNGVLQADKSVYLIGSDMILTLIEPDFDLDNDGAETYTLDLIEWDSDAQTTSMGPKSATGETGAYTSFDPEPSAFRETGDSTGIFQVVIEIPESLNSVTLDRGEKIDLEYTDWGPAGADYVGQEDEDIGLTVYTSNFGATIELDQKVYTWTDKVYITIVAPDHNFDSGLVDEIGNTSNDPVKVSTRGNQLSNYKLVESGADTGIFIGEVTLAGMVHDADGDGTNDITGTAAALTTGDGPTEGALATTDNDGLTVSFEFSEDETVVGSALIRWNIGEVQWLEASYPEIGRAHV
jgi:hypothetical protein